MTAAVSHSALTRHDEQPARKPAFAGLRRARTRWFPALLAFAVIIGLWYFITYVVLDPARRFLMPPPDAVFTDGFFDAKVVTEIGVAMLRTIGVTLTGLAIAIVIGILWAVAMSQAKWVERSLFPYAVILQCIPILALVPLIGFWFGFEFNSRVIVTVMIALFPMVSNTLFGLQSVDVGQRELFQLHRASRWTVLTKLEFPTALPAIFAGMRISAGLAVIGAIVGDFFFRRGQPGIGSLINVYTSRAQSAELFAAVISASLLGVVIFAVFGLFSRLAVGRWNDSAT
jgi:NitT/TauT family transport system permease protein